MRWSENDTYQFVKLYLSHECLWNTEHENYKIKDKKLKAKQSIIRDFKICTGIVMNESELRIKIKNLRSTYTQEIAKIRQRSTQNLIYRPTIKWFSDWHRCVNRKLRKPLANFENDEQESSIDDLSQKIWLTNGVEKVDDEENIDDETGKDPIFTQGNDEYILLLKSEPEEEITQEEKTHSPFKIKRKKVKRKSPSTDQSERNFNGSMGSSVGLIPKEDEFDIYGKYIATQLRKMNLQKALRLQIEIQSLVSEARLSDVKDIQ